MNRISDPGFELGLVWVYTGAAARVTSPAPRSGSYSARLDGEHGGFLGDITSELRQTVESPGESMSFYVNPDGITLALSPHLPLVVTWDSGSGPTLIRRVFAENLPAGWSAIEATVPEGDGLLSLEVAAPPVTGGGFWLLDDFLLDAEDDVTKEREIRDALVARLETIRIANGYLLDIGEVVTKPMQNREIEASPHVQLLRPSITKEVRTFTRKQCIASFPIVIKAKTTGSADADDIVMDVSGEIEKALEIGPNDPGAPASNAWLDLGYVQNVFMETSDPMRVAPDAERDIASCEWTVNVIYNHARRDP